jgi:hypothetical protein
MPYKFRLRPKQRCYPIILLLLSNTFFGALTLLLSSSSSSPFFFLRTPRPNSRSPTRPAVTPTPRPPRRRPDTSIPSHTFARNRTSRATTARRNASPTFVPTPRPPCHSLVMDVEEATIRVPDAPSFVPTPRPPRHGDLVMDVEELPARTPQFLQLHLQSQSQSHLLLLHLPCLLYGGAVSL